MKKIVEYFRNPLHLSAALFVACLGVLAFAYISQYVFHYDPCILCLYQRKPYYAVLALSLVGMTFYKKRPAVTQYTLVLSALSFFVGAAIAAYHTGVEQAWWEGTKSCGDAGLPSGATLDQLREYLSTKRVTRCDVPSWKLFGLSMTNYNLAQSIIFGIGTLWLSLRNKNP